MYHADPIEDAAIHGDMEELAAERAAERHQEMTAELISAVCSDPRLFVQTPLWSHHRHTPAFEVVVEDNAGEGAKRAARLVKLLGQLATGPVGVAEHLEAKALLAEYARAHADLHCEAE